MNGVGELIKEDIVVLCLKKLNYNISLVKEIEKYLPKNTTQNHNYYIAHNIRNDKFNFIRRYDRAVQQTSLFNISEVIRLTDTQRAYLNLY